MNKPGALYLLLGPEVGEKNAFIDEIREALTRLGKSPPEEYRFYSFETPIKDIVVLLRNGSLFAAHRLVIYHGAHDISKKEELTLLAEYAQKPSQEDVLVLVSDRSTVEKKIADCVGPAETKKFFELFEDKKKSWVINCFRRYKARISDDAVELFLGLVENNTQELEKECRSLCFFLGENAEVTAADIETCLYHSKQETVYSLFEFICGLDLEGALEILTKLFLESGEENKPVNLLGGLVWQFRNLLSFSLLLAKNFSPAEAFSRLKIFNSRRNQRVYAAGAKNFSVRELENIVVLCACFEEELRCASAEQRNRAFELFLYCVVARKGINILGS
jgi:DNA polymerase-3 subunit delta